MKVCHLNTCFASCVGALVTLRKAEPANHTRKAIKLNDLTLAIQEIVEDLPDIQEGTIESYTKIFNGIDSVLPDIVGSSEETYSEVMINLVCFCIEELPTKERIKERLHALLKCYPKTDSYDNIRKGHRIFNRLVAEIEIANSEFGDMKGSIS